MSIINKKKHKVVHLLLFDIADIKQNICYFVSTVILTFIARMGENGQ